MKQLVGVALGIAFAVACSGGQKPNGGTTGGGGGGGGGGDDGGGGSAVVADGPITDAECDSFISHIFDVSVGESQKGKPEDKRPTPEEIEKARAALIADPELRKGCLAWTRATATCVMEAQTLAALDPCLKP
jgi:hypothetical protein